MTAFTPVRRRVLALVLASLLATAPLGAAGAAWAGEEPPPPPGGAGSVVREINKGFALLFMLFKLAEIVGPLDFPAQGGAPDPQWGSHPGPLPVGTPPVDAFAPDAPVFLGTAP